MKTIILNKDNLLYKHPDLFAKFVWKDNQAICTIHYESDTHYKVSTNGSMDMIQIPRSIISNLNPYISN